MGSREVRMTGCERAEIIAGLIKLATYAETHPDFPLPHEIHVCYHPGGDGGMRGYAAECIEIQRVAHVLGQPTVFTREGLYRTERDFGGHVVYEAAAIAPRVWPGEAVVG